GAGVHRDVAVVHRVDEGGQVVVAAAGVDVHAQQRARPDVDQVGRLVGHEVVAAAGLQVDLQVGAVQQAADLVHGEAVAAAAAEDVDPQERVRRQVAAEGADELVVAVAQVNRNAPETGQRAGQVVKDLVVAAPGEHLDVVDEHVPHERRPAEAGDVVRAGAAAVIDGDRLAGGGGRGRREDEQAAAVDHKVGRRGQPVFQGFEPGDETPFLSAGSVGMVLPHGTPQN